MFIYHNLCIARIIFGIAEAARQTMSINAWYVDIWMAFDFVQQKTVWRDVSINHLSTTTPQPLPTWYCLPVFFRLHRFLPLHIFIFDHSNVQLICTFLFSSLVGHWRIHICIIMETPIISVRLQPNNNNSYKACSSILCHIIFKIYIILR